MIEDLNFYVDSGDDYDNVESVVELLKKRRSTQISDKIVKKGKNDMSNNSQVTGGVNGDDPVSRNDVVIAIAADVQSLAEVACDSYDEAFEGVDDTQE